MSLPDRKSSPAPRAQVGGLLIDIVTEQQVLQQVSAGWERGIGGWIVTPNVDIWLRARRDSACAELIAQADLVVADGMPLVWASRIAGEPLPERVTGSSLVERLAQAAGAAELSVAIVGGGVGDTAELAGQALVQRYRGLRFVGATVPPFGFQEHPEKLAKVLDEVTANSPDLVLIGLGFPKQEQLAVLLADRLPRAWILGCGGAVAMAAGQARRSPQWAQRLGLEWCVRLVQEPRRLARRYLIDDAPAAVLLLAGSVRQRIFRSSHK